MEARGKYPRPRGRGNPETLFALGNGHLGVRGAHSTRGDGELPGTFINGFHEIWDIKHAENAYGFARTGQRIVYVPDANNFTVSIDGEALSPAESTVLDYHRSVDFSTGVYEETTTWACRSGATVTTLERRAVGFDSRGCLGTELSVSADRDVSADIVSGVVNRRDQPVEDHSVHDPVRSAARRPCPVAAAPPGADGSLRTAWETSESRQRIAMAVDHWISAEGQPFETAVAEDESSVRYVPPSTAAKRSVWRKRSVTSWPGAP